MKIIFYPEIINPETGEVLPEGEKGELVFYNINKNRNSDNTLQDKRYHISFQG